MNLFNCPRREILGLRVRLLTTLTTKGGDVFKKGRVMKIGDRWAQLFELRTLRRNPMKPNLDGSMSRKWGIRRVSKYDFQVLG